MLKKENIYKKPQTKMVEVKLLSHAPLCVSANSNEDFEETEGEW